MSQYRLTARTYPNGASYEEVHLGNILIGTLELTEAGYTSLGRGWRKPVATKEAALEKLRLSAIASRKREIARINSEINLLSPPRSI